MIQVMIAGPASGSGKTTLTCALLEVLRRRGLSPCAFKCGPDYIDPMFHRLIPGVESRNLDRFLAGDRLSALYAAGCQGHGAAVCEGVMGEGDGIGGTELGSTRDIARTLGLPLLRTEDLPLPHIPEAEIPSRHLGLYRPWEVETIRKGIGLLADALEARGDLDRLLPMWDRPRPEAAEEGDAFPGRPVTVAVARDEAFCFLYPESLEALRRAGARTAFFSPLRDGTLPEGACGLYLPGGYPELHSAALSENAAMRAAVAGAVRDGMPTVAECGGFLYLGRALREGERKSPMCGVLPGEGYSAGRLVRFGYATLLPREDSLLFRAGEGVPVHEFHHWDTTEPGDALESVKPVSGRRWRGSWTGKTLYAGFPHLYFAGYPVLAERFMEAARAYETKRGIVEAD